MTPTSHARFRTLLLFALALSLGGTCGCGDVSDEEASALQASPSGAEALSDGRVGSAPEVTAPAASADPPAVPVASELPRTLPLACWLPPGSWCDPRAPGVVCDGEATCDVFITEDDKVQIDCLGGENHVPEGGTCDNRIGVHCAPGLSCFEGVCRPFCCTDAECAPEEQCRALMPRAGTLGACAEPVEEPSAPQCAGPGGFCRSAGDCCSGFCHVDHCH